MVRFITAASLPITLALIVTASFSTAGGDLLSQPAAITPDPEHGMVLYLKHCAKCHGRRAWGNGPREIPTLAGQRERYLIEQLARYISGGRVGSDIHGPAMHDALQPPDVNRAQALGDLASHLSRAARNPQPENGAGEALGAGKRAYTAGCLSCHGDDGAGNEAVSVPAIGGQHYSYLVARLRDFASGRLAHPSPIAALTTEEQQAVADYTSRLPYLSPAGARASAALSL
jgi:cytochrome c553